MHLTRLLLQRFRNHSETVVVCESGINLLLGGNGEGKTNVLEGISYLCLGRSFYGASDASVLQMGGDGFRVEGTVASDGGVEYGISTTFEKAGGTKKTSVGGADIGRRAELIGQFPVVVLSPENASITAGSPGDRRRFLDLTLSQAGRLYLEDLLEYRRALRQRNKLLADAKIGRTAPTGLDPWTELLIVRGARIAIRRLQFVEEFRPYVTRAFEKIVAGQEVPGVEYRSSIGTDPGRNESHATEALRREFEAAEREERRAGTSLIGPHRDDLELHINGLGVREYASQGQHKTFLVGLKMAEFSYLHDRCHETPLLLLDDVFSELDEHRCRQLVHLVGSTGQVFITATDERLVPENGSRRTRYRVQRGTVERMGTHGV